MLLGMYVSVGEKLSVWGGGRKKGTLPFARFLNSDEIFDSNLFHWTRNVLEFMKAYDFSSLLVITAHYCSFPGIFRNFPRFCNEKSANFAGFLNSDEIFDLNLFNWIIKTL